MSYRLIVASAHDTGLADKSVHLIVTSSPYLSLRSYSGNQAIEWRTMSYSPIAGMPEITIKGCDPACVHEWVDGPVKTLTEQTAYVTGRAGGDAYAPGKKLAIGDVKAIQGAYCIHCGGWRGGLGSEPTIEAFIGHLILVLREMWRVLRDDGCMFFNLSDSYSGSGGAHTFDHASPGLSKSAHRDGAQRSHTSKLRPKNLMGVPQRFFLAAQAEGWIMRQLMPWLKRNQMPDSCTDRPGGVVESIFLMTKNERYFWDAVAVEQPASQPVGESQFTGQIKQMDLRGRNLAQSKLGTNQGAPKRNFRSSDLFFRTWEGMLLDDCGDPLAMIVNPKGFSGSHFACFPPELPEMAILCGTSHAGVCPHCGKQWRRCVEKAGQYQAHWAPGTQALVREGIHGNSGVMGTEMVNTYRTTGWAPSCTCPVHAPIPATVLDPFVGSGTTCMVAEWLGRDSIGLDLSDEYHALAHERINTPREKIEDRRAPADGQMGLFEEFAL